MENASFQEAPAIHALAPFAGQFLEMVKSQAKSIPEDAKKDPSAVNAFFQKYHDIAHDLERDAEFNFSDLQKVREGIDALRQQVMTQIRSDFANGPDQNVPEAA